MAPRPSRSRGMTKPSSNENTCQRNVDSGERPHRLVPLCTLSKKKKNRGYCGKHGFPQVTVVSQPQANISNNSNIKSTTINCKYIFRIKLPIEWSNSRALDRLTLGFAIKN